MSDSAARLAREVAAARDAARTYDYDRFLAMLLSPAPAREGLAAVAAFFGEATRIPVVVNEPAVGEIRLQWWRDALLGDGARSEGHPFAGILRGELETGRASPRDVETILDACSGLLYPHSLTSGSAVAAFLDTTQGAAFRLSAGILGVADTASAAAMIEAAAQSYGRVQLLRLLPLMLSKGCSPFPAAADWQQTFGPMLAEARYWLAEARRREVVSPAALRPAVLPVALVEPYLRALETLGPRLSVEQAAISPLTRVWRIYRANRRGRL